MKKTFAIYTVLIFFSFQLFAQATVNPSDNFYSKAQEWQIKGLIDNLPPLRPYPLNVIKNILNTVIQSDNENESTLAKEYWQEITGKSWNFDVGTNVNSNLDDFFISIHPSLNGDLTFKDDFVTMGYNLAIDARNDDFTNFYPSYTEYPYDAIQDPATVGPADVFLDINNILNVGTTNTFLQCGIYRSGFGEFLNEGITLNDSAYHKGNLSFMYLSPKLDYSQQFSVIGSTLSYNGSELAANKFLAFHSVKFKIIPKLNISYYENIIFGNRFDISYLIPSPYMVAQGLGGCNDNLQMGLLFDYYPVNNLAFNFDVMVDDFDVNSLVKFNLDSKNRIAGTLGTSYTPKSKFIDRVDLLYSLITPYTYSHWDYYNKDTAIINSQTYNYQNYTNCGKKIGSHYDPNSDVITLSTNIIPLKNLNINLTSKFIRHGNICESLTDDEILLYLLSDKDVYSTDGSLYTHSMFSNPDSSYGKHVDTAWNHLNFLTQNHISYTFQQNVNLSYKIPEIFKFCSISFNLDYTFEYIHNYGINNHLFEGGNIQKNQDGSYTWNNNHYENMEALQNDSQIISNYYKDIWISNLTDRINNIVSVYLLFSF